MKREVDPETFMRHLFDLPELDRDKAIRYVSHVARSAFLRCKTRGREFQKLEKRLREKGFPAQLTPRQRMLIEYAMEQGLTIDRILKRSCD